ncbi:exopolygalacturonase [Niveomyces insectorum RCEF 264]|uniref:galacturonan 1,4-alpha-galacturonidase n=1 Tax=Niveomyces insectorum RCEF 264 TaxID=1081102 RepID=A0A167N8Q2_9HYPO|nr:exopolygalacturonase [Niveomyces insectorum RCEF 264]
MKPLLLLPFLVWAPQAFACHSDQSPPDQHVSPRPRIVPSPKQPRVPIPSPPARSQVCYVETHDDGVTDDSAYILYALHTCNDGGHVVFSEGRTFVVGTAMDWTFLKHIDIDIQGTISFTDDTAYWQASSFRFVYQNITSFFLLGGEDVWIYGGGTLNGNGQAWYDLHAKDVYTLRPTLIGIDGLKESIISNLQLQSSPMYYSFVANASNVVFSGINISGASTSKVKAKNTDGWDTYRSTDVTIMNSVIQNGDDCVSFKPNSTHILVQSLDCTGSHGISVGSLGQYAGTFDIVEHVYVANVSMHRASDGARIKVWPNTPSALSGDLQGGGGGGRVDNITYDGMLVDRVDYAIEITQCYGQKNLALCTAHPSPLTIRNIVFRNFRGTTSAKYAPAIAAFACSSTAVCGSISAVDIDVVSPTGTHEAYCLDQDEAQLNVTCTDSYKGFN